MAQVTDVSTTYNCSISEESPSCFRYVPLPGLTGSDVVTVEGCSANGCEDVIVNIAIGGCTNTNENGRYGNPVLDLGCKMTPAMAFTPNDDGINENWKLIGAEECSSNTMIRVSIYDKGGRLVNEQLVTLTKLSGMVMVLTIRNYQLEFIIT